MSDFADTPIIELAVIVANHLQQKNIRVVLVGGLAVEIYSENKYLTKDIDMVDISYQKPVVLHQAMAEIGFEKKGRVFINETTDISVEFPSAPISVGDELVTKTTVVETEAGRIPILFAKDVVKDRLAAYFHWQDQASLVQALAVIIKHPFTPADLKDFCLREGKEDEIDLILGLLKTARKQQISNMADIEKLVIKEILRRL